MTLQISRRFRMFLPAAAEGAGPRTLADGGALTGGARVAMPDRAVIRQSDRVADVLVRRARVGDAADVRAMIERAIRGSSPDLYSMAQIEAWAMGGSVDGVCTMIETTVAFVAVSRGRVVGFSNLDGADVDQLYVDPDLGGKGVARKLFDAVERVAVERAVATLTAAASLRAISTFRRFGFVERARVDRPFNGGTFEVAYMVKDLRAPA